MTKRLRGKILLVLPSTSTETLLECCYNGFYRKFPGDPARENGRFWGNFGIYLYNNFSPGEALAYVDMFNPRYILFVKPPSGDFYPKRQQVRVPPERFPNLKIRAGERMASPICLLRAWARDKGAKWVRTTPEALLGKEEVKLTELECWLKTEKPERIIEAFRAVLLQKLAEEERTLRPATEEESEKKPSYVLDTDVDVPPVKWLIPGLLPAGTSVLLTAREGVGKTTVALALGAEVVRRGKGKVLLIAAEHPTDLKNKKREYFSELAPLLPLLRDGEGNYDFSLINPIHLSVLEKALEEHPEICLVVLDSLRPALRGLRGLDNSPEAGVYLRQLHSLICEKHRRGLLVIHHHRKSAGSAEDKASGTTDIRAAVRLEIQIKPTDEYTRVLNIVKNNLGVQFGQWRVIKYENTLSLRERKRKSKSARELVSDWLRHQIHENGFVWVKDAYDYAESLGLDSETAKTTAKRAKELMDLESVRDGVRWKWCDPDWEPTEQIEKSITTSPCSSWSSCSPKERKPSSQADLSGPVGRTNQGEQICRTGQEDQGEQEEQEFKQEQEEQEYICPACGGNHWWIRIGSERKLCAVCHPPPSREVIAKASFPIKQDDPLPEPDVEFEFSEEEIADAILEERQKGGRHEQEK